MLKRLSIVALGVMLVALVAPMAFAASSTLSYNLVYSGSFNSSNVATGYALTSGTVTAGQIAPTDRHRFSMRFTITGAEADESLAYLQASLSGPFWNAALTGGNFGALAPEADTANPNHNPDPVDGNVNPRNLWKARQDNGAANDWDALTGITDELDEWYAAHAFEPGEAGGALGADYKFARVTGNFTNGAVPGVYTLTLAGDNVSGNYLVWDGGTEFFGEGDAVTVDRTANVNPFVFTFTIVPEPTTLVLAGLALPALGLVALRRRKA